jgi:CheY-like chemotaxis protein
MDEKINVLIIEDLPSDAELTEREIRKTLKNCVFKRVETQEEFLISLNTFKPDIIISDYMLPTFDGMAALKLTLENAPLIPFIILTGSMNEDTAVECMKFGATDYVIKEHITKLGRSVLNALEQIKIRKEKDRMQEDLIQSEQLYRNLFETMVQGVVYQSADGKIISANPAAEKILGLTLDQMMGRASSDPRWKAIKEDGSDFPGHEHTSMVALKTGQEIKNIIMGVFNSKIE